MLIGLLSLWWFALVGPMLFVLKNAAGAFISIEETPSGDWSLRVPFQEIVPGTPEHPVPHQIRSIDFDVMRSDAIAFTFSLPVYWAIILASPGFRRLGVRALLLGTLVVSVVEVALLLAFAQIAAGNAFSQFGGTEP